MTVLHHVFLDDVLFTGCHLWHNFILLYNNLSSIWN